MTKGILLCDCFACYRSFTVQTASKSILCEAVSQVADRHADEHGIGAYGRARRKASSPNLGVRARKGLLREAARLRASAGSGAERAPRLCEGSFCHLLTCDLMQVSVGTGLRSPMVRALERCV